MPVWDEITPSALPASRRPWVTLGFLGLAIATHASFPLLYHSGREALWPLFAFSEATALEELHLWQFFTYILVPPPGLHPLSLLTFGLSITVGVYVTARLGMELEGEIGPLSMVALIFFSAACGALAHALFQILSGSPASAGGFLPTAVAVGLVVSRRAPSRTVLFAFFLPMRLSTAAVLGALLALFFSLLEIRTGHTSFFTILGAGATALLLHLLSPRLERVLQERLARVARDAFLREYEIRRRSDELLEKISRSGMGSLTAAEQRILRKASRLLTRHPRGESRAR